MTDAAAGLPRVAEQPIALPVREWIPWAVFIGVLLLFLVYLVGAEEGALSLFGGMKVHEWVHDARHLLGFPCH
jgi:hypothetical protein